MTGLRPPGVVSAIPKGVYRTTRERKIETFSNARYTSMGNMNMAPSPVMRSSRVRAGDGLGPRSTTIPYASAKTAQHRRFAAINLNIALVCALIAATFSPFAAEAKQTSETMALGGNAGTKTVLGAPVHAQSPGMSRPIVSLVNHNTSIRWRVITGEPGVRLRLYADHGLQGPQLLADEAAMLGDHEYRLFDRAPSEGFVRYELRYVDAEGAEVSLGAVLGIVPMLNSHSSTLNVAQILLGDLISHFESGINPAGSAGVSNGIQPCSFVPLVPTPPPRSLSSSRFLSA